MQPKLSSAPKHPSASTKQPLAVCGAERMTMEDLPDEMLCEIASHLDFGTLLACFNVSRRWRQVAAGRFAAALEATRLVLLFHQEGQERTYFAMNRYVRAVEFGFKGYDCTHERLVFERVRNDDQCRFQSSVMVQQPRLQAVSFVGRSRPKDLSQTRNLLDKQVPLQVSQLGQRTVKSAKHCGYPWAFTYDSQRTAAASGSSKTGSADRTARIVHPLTFECSPNFLNEDRLGPGLVNRWYQSKFGEGGSLRSWLRRSR